MKIVISIVSHKQSSLIDNLLKSFDKFLFCMEHEVVITITQNTHEKYGYLCKFPIKVTENLSLKGFGSNHNCAFESENPDIFLIVNPDIELFEKFDLDNLTEQVLAKDIAITSPVIVDDKFKLVDYKRADITVWNLIKRRLWGAKLEKFDWYAGMFLIVKGADFKRLEGFDTRFFMYVEDCDLCMRARRQGLIVDDIISSRVIHSARRTSHKSFKYTLWHLNSIFKYLLKRIYA